VRCVVYVQCEQLSADRVCMLECGPDKTCHVDTCCARLASSVSNQRSSSDVAGLRRIESDGSNFHQFTNVISFLRSRLQRQDTDTELQANDVAQMSNDEI